MRANNALRHQTNRRRPSISFRRGKEGERERHFLFLSCRTSLSLSLSLSLSNGSFLSIHFHRRHPNKRLRR